MRRICYKTHAQFPFIRLEFRLQSGMLSFVLICSWLCSSVYPFGLLGMQSCTWFNATAHRSSPHFTFETEARTDNVKNKSQQQHIRKLHTFYCQFSLDWSVNVHRVKHSDIIFVIEFAVRKKRIPSRWGSASFGDVSSQTKKRPTDFISAKFVWFTTTSVRHNLTSLVACSLYFNDCIQFSLDFCQLIALICHDIR